MDKENLIVNGDGEGAGSYQMPKSLNLAVRNLVEAEHGRRRCDTNKRLPADKNAPLASNVNTVISDESLTGTLILKGPDDTELVCPTHETANTSLKNPGHLANMDPRAIHLVETGSAVPPGRVKSINCTPSRLERSANSLPVEPENVAYAGSMHSGSSKVFPDYLVSNHNKTRKNELRSRISFDSKKRSKCPPICDVYDRPDAKTPVQPTSLPDQQFPDTSHVADGNEEIEAGYHSPPQSHVPARSEDLKNVFPDMIQNLPSADIPPDKTDHQLVVAVPVAQTSTVIQRLQRAMESRSRLEAENRRKLELDSRRKEEGRNQREVEAAERRRAKDVAEAREKDEKRRRHMKLQQARREQEHAQRAAEEEQNRMRRLLVEQGKYERQSLANAAKRKSLNTVRSVEEKKRRLQKFMANSAVTLANEISASAPVQGRQTHLTSEECDSQDSKKHTKSGKCISYEISPYRSGSDTDEDEERPYPRKPIPDWARTDALVAVLTKQASVDPDEIFQNTTKTCSLGAVFTSHMERTCSRRSSSGDWFSDRLTWREELTYKKDMGFLVNK